MSLKSPLFVSELKSTAHDAKFLAIVRDLEFLNNGIQKINESTLVLPDASESIKGITKLSVPPILITSPIAVGDNDPRNSDARTPIGTALNSGQIFIGNATNVVSSVALSGDATLSNTGAITLATVPIEKGGTGQITANAAINALLPSQTSNAGNFLTTNGTDISWAAISGTLSGGVVNFIPKWSSPTTQSNSQIFDNGTNIGIGISNPAHKLDIDNPGTGIISTQRLQNTFIAAINNGSQLLFAANRTISGLTNVAAISGMITDISDTAYKGALILSTANNALPTEKVRIGHDGHVGIGTFTAGVPIIAQLHVVGTTTATTSFRIDAATINFGYRENLLIMSNEGFLGLGTPMPLDALHIHAISAEPRAMRFTSDNVAHGITLFGLTNDTFLRFQPFGSLTGGGIITGVSDNNSSPGLTFWGVVGTATPTVSPVNFIAGKKNIASIQPVALSEKAFSFFNSASGDLFGQELITILGDGNLGVGLIPKFKTHINGRLTYNVPATTPIDADLSNGQVSAHLNATETELIFRLKTSDGTIKTGTVQLLAVI